MGKQLAGKSAVVTGSTSGIGQGIAERFAREGANVMLNGFGDAAAIEALRARPREGQRRRSARLPRRRHVEARRDRGDWCKRAAEASSAPSTSS